MLNIHFKPFPELQTNRLLLREVTLDDALEIFELRSDPRVMKFIDRPPALSVNDAKEFINKIKNLEANDECITWAICEKKNSPLMGTICFWNITKEHFRTEIGYALRFDFHGKGIMQEAMTTVINFGFNQLKFHSVEANVNPENIASIKLLERNNFVREAYFRENYFFEGKFLDSAIYSLVVAK